MQKISTIKQYVLIIIFVIPFISLYSQGLIERRLSYNPVLASKKKNKEIIPRFLRSSSIADTISLGPKGIFDDFAYLSSYPDSAIWLDSAVFINRGYGLAPPSIGVATFDGLDYRGYPYNFFTTSTAPAPADTLTSKPIDLNYPDVDSIYLSFYCQAQGIGNDPQVGDILLLEFKSPDAGATWDFIWSSDGYALTDSAWKYVMIPITDSKYLKKGFQFRFRNYATVNGNYDHWNIDDVYLNRVRTYKDNVLSDITWVYNGQSLLKDYTAIPWKQYTSSELINRFNNLIRNNDSVLKNINYNYKIDNITTSASVTSFNGAGNIYPFNLNKIYTDCDVPLGCISSVPINTSAFPGTLSQATQIKTEHYFNSGILGDFSPRNDTLTVVNNFLNYFAYDDGTAETAVGLNALNAQLAIQFTLKVADSLSAVDIFFNPLTTNAELYLFNLFVWPDVGGAPGSLPVYASSRNIEPVYTKSGQNIFTRYYLDSPIYSEAGTYYIGFRQKTEEPLNVGLDKNTNTQNRIFFNVNGYWETSAIPGSLMMRPITGYELNPNSIEAIYDNEQALVVFPNPVKDKLYIQNVQATIAYQIIDIFGKILIEGVYEPNTDIDVSPLSSGVYFLKTTSAVSKFIKTD